MTEPEVDRGQRRTEVGVVTSDKMDKTRRVEIPRLVKHPQYGKYIRRRTICHVHDEANVSHTGDTVKIMESRPYSKTKHWLLLEVVKPAAGSKGATEATVEAKTPAATTA
jgi:small subunit ribosomal protein S17